MENTANYLSKEELHGEERRWSELLPDMLRFISNRLPDLTDFARFRAVCRNWQSEAPLSDPPPQFPWILTRPDAVVAGSDDKINQYLQFYSLPHGDCHSVSVPECFKKELMGPSTMYAFAADRTCSSLTLFNPLGGDEVPLPPIDLDWCFPICTSLNRTGHVAICGGKTESKNQVLAVCCPGVDAKWTAITKALEGCLMIFHKGMYVVYNPETGATEAVDATSGAVVSAARAPPATKLTCLVESDGELLGISCDRGTLDQDRSSDCKIYQLDDDYNKWVPVSGGIGARILFLDGGQGISIAATGSIESEKNSIFCLESHERIKFDGVSITYSLSKYDIGKKSWERKSLPSMEKPGWFLPSY